MATKSILKNVVITDKKKARDFVMAAEKALAWVERIEIEHKDVISKYTREF